MFPSLAFLLAAVALAVIPGPGLTYVVARTVAGGRAEGFASSFGTATGGMVHVLLAALGLSLLVAELPVLYAAIKYLGAAYLLYLGLRILLSPPRRQSAGSSGGRVRRMGTQRAYRDGIIVEALNIKTAMFFIAFIPQFVSPLHHFAAQFVMLGCVCVLLNTLADIVAVMAASRFLAAPGAQAKRERMLACVSGVVMIVLGAFVAFGDAGR